MKRLLFVVNAPEYFISHRYLIAKRAQSLGFEVHVASPPGKHIVSAYDDPVGMIMRAGFIFHEVPIERGGQNPFKEVVSIVKLLMLMVKVSPDIAHLITIKPVLYGGLAARLANIEGLVVAIAGLGSLSLSRTVISSIRNRFLYVIYRIVFSHKNMVAIFQNKDDLKSFFEMGLVDCENSTVIKGSGVDTKDYRYSEEACARPVVVMASRLIRDKGVFEYVEAARILKKRGVDVLVRLIGAPDPGNPTSATLDEIEGWRAEGVVELLGYRDDIAYQYANSSIVCLPSYREGLPKALIEAAACGRPVVTTDVPGCRDAVIDGVTGITVPVKDSTALADAIQRLVESPSERRQMGVKARKFAEETFTTEQVVERHIDIYKDLTGVRVQ